MGRKALKVMCEDREAELMSFSLSFRVHPPDQSVANLLLRLIFLPYLKNRYGNGSIASVKKPRREDAH